MAMESVAALSDELSRTNAERLSKHLSYTRNDIIGESRKPRKFMGTGSDYVCSIQASRLASRTVAEV